MTDGYLWETFLQHGKDAFERKDYEQAHEAFSLALSMAEEQYGPVDLRVAMSCNNLATVQEARGQAEAALDLLKRSLAIVSENLGDNHPEVAIALANLASTCRSLGRLDQARGYLEEALKVARNHGPEESEGALTRLARFHQETGQAQAAIEPLREIVTLRMRLHGADAPEVASGLVELSMAQEAAGDSAAARVSRERGLGKYKRSLGEDNPQYAQVLLRLANQLHSSGLLEPAEQYCSKAASLLEDRLGRSHSLVGEALETLAGIQAGLGQLDEALLSCQRVLALREKSCEPGDIRIGSALKNLAGLFLAKQELDSAEEHYQKAIAIFETSLGELHPALLATLEEMVQLYHHNGQGDKALAVQKRIVKATEERLGHDDPSLAEVYAGAAQLAFMNSALESALHYSRQALRIWQSIQAEEQLLARCHFNIVTALTALGQIDATEDHYQRLLELGVEPYFTKAKEQMRQRPKALELDPPGRELSLEPPPRSRPVEALQLQIPTPEESKPEEAEEPTVETTPAPAEEEEVVPAPVEESPQEERKGVAMADEVENERRAHPRKNVGLNKIVSAKLRVGSGSEDEVKVFLVNLSRGGMRINTEAELPDGEFSLHFAFSELDIEREGQLELPCQVAWKKELVGGTYVHGLAFTSEALQLDQVLASLDGGGQRERFRLYRPLPVSVKVPEEEDWIECYAGNLNPEGVGLQLPRPLPEEEALTVRLHLEFGFPTVAVNAQVAWSREAEGVHHLGLRFSDVDPFEARTVQRYIDRCLEA